MTDNNNLRITYTYKGVNYIVSGQHLTPIQTNKEPIVSLNGLETNNNYTFIMYDPNSVFGNHIHWVVSDIKGNDFSSGKTIFPYGGPTPPKGSGIHNYTFSLYKSDTPVMVDEKFDQNNRTIPLNKLLSELNITGNPVSTIKFKSQYIQGGYRRKSVRRNKSFRRIRRNRSVRRIR